MKRFRLLLAFVLMPLSCLAQDLQKQLDALAPGDWLDYEVPMQPGVHAPCCIEWSGSRPRDAACRLDREGWNSGHRDSDPVAPDGARLRILLRRDAEGLDRIRAIGSACPLDAAGERVVSAGSIDPERSVELLEHALAGADRRVRHDAVAAIAHHAGAAADTALRHGADPSRPRALRRDAVFWLARNRGEPGFRSVRALLDDEGNDEIRRHAVFAISVSPAPSAQGELRRIARSDRRADLRGEAVFWLAQQDDAQTEEIVFAMLANERSEDLHEKAIFALSQLPPARAVPALRRLVDPGEPREVRRRALFWLAQVDDDDAVLPVFDRLLGAED
jgi:HEAT repeat protein